MAEVMRYAEYKDSGVEWLGDIPAEWKVTRVKNLLYEVNLRSEKGDECPLSMSQTYGVIPSHLLTVPNPAESLIGNKIVSRNDLVFNKLKAHLGVFAVSKYEGIVSPDYAVYRIKGKNSPKFLEFLFKTENCIVEFTKYITGVGAGLSRLYTSDLFNIYVAIPMPEEQQAISSYLDDQCVQIDDIIANAKSSIEEYKTWKASVIYEAVTKGVDASAEMKDSGVDLIGEMPTHWGLKRQRFLCRTMTGNRDTQDAETEGVYPFYVRSPIVERSNSYTFEGEGILMAGDGAGAGKVFHHAFGKYAIHQRVYCFYEFRDILPRYYYYFMSNLFSTEIDKGSAKSTVPSVRLPMLLNFYFCLPPEEEQKRICDWLDAKSLEIDQLISEKEALIADLESYKKSLIYEVVTGKRKVV